MVVPDLKDFLEEEDPFPGEAPENFSLYHLDGTPVDMDTTPET